MPARTAEQRAAYMRAYRAEGRHAADRVRARLYNRALRRAVTQLRAAHPNDWVRLVWAEKELIMASHAEYMRRYRADPTKADKLKESRLHRLAYSRATQKLRQAHQAEFHELFEQAKAQVQQEEYGS